MDPSDIPAFLGKIAATSRHDDGNSPKIAPDIEAIRLRDARASFTTQHTFQVGDIVRQKKSAAGYNTFGENDLAIVMEILTDPLMLDEIDGSAGSPYFRKPLDMVIGVLCMYEGRNDSFHMYHVDSRHFEPAPEGITQ